MYNRLKRGDSMQPIFSYDEFMKSIGNHLHFFNVNHRGFHLLLSSKIAVEIQRLHVQKALILCGPSTDYLNVYDLKEQLALLHIESFILDIQKENHFSYDVDLIVDAITLTSNSITDKLAHLIDELAIGNIPVLSIQFPYSLDPVSGLTRFSITPSTYTLIIHHLCYAHVLNDGFDMCGTRIFMTLSELLPWSESLVNYLPKSSMTLDLPPRKHHSHKYNYGHVLIIGGSPTMMGSVALSSTAALRSGCGLVSLAVHQANLPYTRVLPYEIMTPTYHDESSFNQLLDKKSSVAFGMGLSKDPLPFDMVKILLKKDIPLVIDADGLFHSKETLKKPHQNTRVVLTPHIKEFASLLDLTIFELQQDLIRYTQAFAKETSSIVLLKGPCTVVASVDKVILVEAGHPGLAKAGSGDVLSGVIATYLAQNTDTYNATIQALIHMTLVSEACLSKYSIESLLASDVIYQLSTLSDN